MAMDRFEITHKPAASSIGNMHVAAEEGQGVSRCPGRLRYHRDDMIAARRCRLSRYHSRGQ
jgi:hypothetical protein